MNVAIAVLLLTYCQVHGDVMRRNERLGSADNATETSSAVSKNSSTDVEREAEAVVEKRQVEYTVDLKKNKRSDEEFHLQRDHTDDSEREARSSEFDDFGGEDEEDEDDKKDTYNKKRKVRSIESDYERDEEDNNGNESLNGRVHNFFVIFDFSKKDAKAKAALMSMFRKLMKDQDGVVTDDDDVMSEDKPFDESPNFKDGMPLQHDGNDDSTEKIQIRGRLRIRPSKRRKSKKIKKSLCSKKNKRMVAKREISGCKGAVEFSKMVCADYNACISKNGNNCEALICPKFKSVSKRESCYNQLFDCEN